MYNEIDVIEKHPISLLVSFNVDRTLPGLLQAQFYFIGDSLNLTRIGSAANQKVVGESAGSFLELEDCDFFRFLLLAGAEGFLYLSFEIVLLHSVVVVGLSILAEKRAEGLSAEVSHL